MEPSQRPSDIAKLLLFILYFKNSKRGVFHLNTKQNYVSSPTVRKYTIEGITYIVKATAREGCTEDAAAKVRRLIRNDIKKQIQKY